MLIHIFARHAEAPGALSGRGALQRKHSPWRTVHSLLGQVKYTSEPTGLILKRNPLIVGQPESAAACRYGLVAMTSA